MKNMDAVQYAKDVAINRFPGARVWRSTIVNSMPGEAWWIDLDIEREGYVDQTLHYCVTFEHNDWSIEETQRTTFRFPRDAD